jgi:hypothetical protein
MKWRMENAELRMKKGPVLRFFVFNAAFQELSRG